MKRGTPEHPKTRRLARRLGLPIYSAVGLLELLWHFTARYSPRGDIGRHQDADIADAVGWDGDVHLLISSLVAERWLDECDEYRLLVHGWSDHADEAVRKSLARSGVGFTNGGTLRRTTADNGGQRRTKSAKVGLPEPEPEPFLALPEPSPSKKEKNPPVSPRKRGASSGPTDPPDRLTDDQRQALDAWCAEKHPGKLARIRDLEEAALDYFRSRGKRHRDWVATVRTWVRNERASPDPRKMDPDDVEREAVEMIRARREQREQRKSHDSSSSADVRRLQPALPARAAGDVRGSPWDA